MGAACARLFAEHGATLTLFDMNEAALTAVAHETGGTAVAINLADGPAVNDAVNAAASAMGGLDGIVNAAGILRLKPIEEITFEEQDMLLRVNIGGVANMIRAALPPGWQEANKTGAGSWRARNIVSVMTPPGRNPIWVAAYLFAAKSELAERNRQFVPLGRAIVESVG